MQYRVSLKRLIGGQYYARCNTAPGGVAVGQGETMTEALDKLRQEIRFQLEYCPCSGVADDYVELEVVEPRPTRGSA